MILTTLINALYSVLKDETEKRNIEKFSIHIRLTNEILIYIVSTDKNYVLPTSKTLESYANNVDVVIYTPNEAEEDGTDELFEKEVDFNNSRRRLKDITEPIHTNFSCPVITFYSYKGGMGRSTTLAAYAMHLALNKGKRVFILDCDLEAPGFTNFFLENSGEALYQDGLVEYLMDESVSGETPDLKNYIRTVPKRFVKEGAKDDTKAPAIFIMSAGNTDARIREGYTDERCPLDDYQEGLARLPLTQADVMATKIQNIINAVAKHPDYQPDVVLIDSRTGFNDIFTATASYLSDVVVGFFGTSVQTHSGLYEFIQRYNETNTLREQKKIPKQHCVLANSIVPADRRDDAFEDFDLLIGDTINRIAREGRDVQGAPEIVTMWYDPILALLGTPREKIHQFVELVRDVEYKPHRELFAKIDDKIQKKKINEVKINETQAENLLVLPPKSTDLNKNLPIENSQNSDSNIKISAPQLRKKILQTIDSKWPDLYALSIDFDKEYQENRYYYRTCMGDIFNIDLFLVIGSKGTGKSYIYKSLENQDILTQLRRFAKQDSYTYSFMPLVAAVENANFIKTSTLDISQITITKEVFYHRFWIVYMWNVLVENTTKIKNFRSTASVKPFSININNSSNAELLYYITDKTIFEQIEKDLEALDAHLSKYTTERFVLMFDQLDDIVSPSHWDERIAPLINFWKRKPYKALHAKIFIRRDLFQKIGGVNNIRETINRSINLEWSQKEIFAYFFKLVFSLAKKDMIDYINDYSDDDLTHTEWDTVIDDIERKYFDFDEAILRKLSSVFFGEVQQKFNSKAYDWLFVNLQNADKTINIRPFIGLLKLAIGKCLKESDFNDLPILPQRYYTNTLVRARAVEEYINELIKENGYQPLDYIFEFLKKSNDTENKPYKKQILTYTDMKGLIEKVKNKNLEKFKVLINDGTIKSDKADDLIKMLEDAGIIFKRFRPGGTADYTFAFLFKYYLGLGGDWNQ